MGLLCCGLCGAPVRGAADFLDFGVEGQIVDQVPLWSGSLRGQALAVEEGLVELVREL